MALLPPSILHGATGSMAFEIRGDDAHGARPHLTHNAIRDLGITS